MSYLFLVLFCQISIQENIKNLGSSDYNIRVQAQKKLEKLDYKAIPFLKENFENKDLEIALSCKTLYYKYYHVTDSDGLIPNIWYLDEEIRFPKGRKVTIDKAKNLCDLVCERDLSLEYMDKARSEVENLIEHDACLINWCGDILLCSCDYCYYKSEIIASFATENFIKDYLDAGKDRNKLKQIIQNCSDNSKKYKIIYRKGFIPGIMVRQPLK